MMGKLNADQAREMMLQVAEAVIAAKEALGEADRNIGDGDHGVGMAHGFAEVQKELDGKEFTDVYQVFSVTGRTMIKSMGGASGIIFGLLFYAGSKEMPPQGELTEAEFMAIFAKALTEIQAKGQAQVGDKTVVDALDPLVKSLQKSVTEGHSFPEMLAKAAAAAEEGKEASKKYVAKFGKARTLGERAVGFPDAGAVSLTVIIKAISEWMRENL